ncbi:hypothetical protein MMPV_007153 [Pyropia vietnamensis]
MAGARGATDRRAGGDARQSSGGSSGGGRSVHGSISGNGSGSVGGGGGGGGAATSPPPGGAVHLVAPLRVKTRLLQRARMRLVRVRCSTLTLGPSGELPPVGGTFAHVSRLVGSGTWSSKPNGSRSMAATPLNGPDDSLRVNMVGLRVTPMPKKRPLEIDIRLPSGALLFFFFDDLPTFSAWRTALLTAARRVTDVYTFRGSRLLGTGDNSRVYAVLPLAGDAAGIRRPVALKEVKKSALSAAQLECESTAMDAYAGLRHPALVPALDMFDEPDRLVTVTPYMPGGSLDKHQAPFSGRAVVSVMRSLLQCLVYLHARGIVHRDIKPENILLGSAAADWPWTARVGDFGFAATLYSGHTRAGDTGGLLREVLGTPQFLAPDFFRRHSLSGERLGYGTAVDLWSAGVVLVWMLTGELPFQGAFLVDIVKAVRTGAMLPAGLDAVCPEARSLVRGLLQMNPERRLTALAALHHPYLSEAGATTETASSSSMDALATATFVSCELPQLVTRSASPITVGTPSGWRPCTSALCPARVNDGRVGSVNLPPSYSAASSPMHAGCMCTGRRLGVAAVAAGSPPRGPASDDGLAGDLANLSSRSLRLSGASAGGSSVGGLKPPLLPSPSRRQVAGGASARALTTAATTTPSTTPVASPPQGYRQSAPPCAPATSPPPSSVGSSSHRICSDNTMLSDDPGGRWVSSVDVFTQPPPLSRLASPSLASMPWAGTSSISGRRASTLSSSSRSGGRSAPPPGFQAALRWRRLVIVVLAGRRFAAAGRLFVSNGLPPPAPPLSSVASTYSSTSNTSFSGVPSASSSSTYLALRSHGVLRRSSAHGPSIAARVSSFDSGRLWSRSASPAAARLTASLSTEVTPGGEEDEAAGTVGAIGSSGTNGSTGEGTESPCVRLPGRHVASRRSHSMHRHPTTSLAGVAKDATAVSTSNKALPTVSGGVVSVQSGGGVPLSGGMPRMSQSFTATSASYRTPGRPAPPPQRDAVRVPSLARPSVAALVRKLSRRGTSDVSDSVSGDGGGSGVAIGGGSRRPGAGWVADESGDGLRSSIMRSLPRNPSQRRRERGGGTGIGGRGSTPAAVGRGEATSRGGGAAGRGSGRRGGGGGGYNGVYVRASTIEGLILKFSSGEPALKDAPSDIHSAMAISPQLVASRGTPK